ncbi:MAG: class D sortase [Clostridium sp.]|uniref:class D sortase n=1 Tax=Clostridium sp. LY3-2 TaxID=2942482 RepID=UPI002152717E|nr:class D sortase [Clostridium sp. LY3-2]MCR6516439.1 class D sortase [Clostridium sp. LY3-2]
MKKLNIKRILGVILILFGISFIAYPFIEIKLDNNKIKDNIEVWDSKKTEVLKNMDNIKIEDKDIDKKPKTIKVDGKEIYGKIIVEKTGEEIPLLIGATEENLKDGANIYDNGILPGENGTVIILGHRETTFGFLENIKENDKIEIETLGRTYTYKVNKTFITKPDDKKILENKKGKNLTLVTCYPFKYVGPAPERFIVNLTEV